MATGGVGISDTRHHGNPEHKALMESHLILVTSISRSPKDIADILVPLDVFSQNDKADIRSDGLNDVEKARRIVKILTDKVEIDPSFYHRLIANLMEHVTWMKYCLEKVCKNFDNAKQAEPSHNSNDNSEMDSENVITVVPVGLYTHLSETEPLIVPSEKFDEEKLEKLTADIKKNFASLAACVADALVEDGVTPRSLIFYLQELEAVESDKIKAKSILYFDENFIKIAKKNCLVVHDVFEMIRDYYSWVNYGLLENVIDTYLDRNEVIRKKRRLYENQYKTYCKRRVCKIPRNRFMVFSSRRQGTELVFKIDEKWDEIRMERIETIRDRINMVFKFNYHTLSLKTVRNGCVEVTFEIPKHVADVVLPLTEEQVQILKQHSITLIAERVSQFIGGTATQPSLGGIDNEQLLRQPFIDSKQRSEQLLGEVSPREQDEDKAMGQEMVVTEENAGGDASNCLITSASSPIVAGASVYVKERDCKELRAELSELRSRAEAAEQQIEKERGEKDEQLLQEIEKLRKVTEKLEKTKNEYESSAGVFLTLKNTEIKRLESEHQKRLDEVTKEKERPLAEVSEQKLALKDEGHAQELALKEEDLEKKLSEKTQHLETQLSEKEHDLEKRLIEKEEDLEKKLTKLAESKKEFEQQLSDEAEQFKQQQAQKDEELREATHQLETYIEQLEENKKQLVDACTKEEQLKSDNADLKDQVKVLTEEKQALEKTIKELGEEARVLNQQMGELQTANKKLQETTDKCVQAIEKSEEQSREENARITKELIQAKDNVELMLKLLQPALCGSLIAKLPGLHKTMTKSSSTSYSPDRSPPPETRLDYD